MKLKEVRPKNNFLLSGQIMTSSKRISTSLSPNEIGSNLNQRRKSSAYIRSKSARQFDQISEDGEGIQVSPSAKIIWFAKQSVWAALDALLDKLLLEDKFELKFDRELLPVGGISLFSLKLFLLGCEDF